MTDINKPPILYTVREVAQLLRVHQRTAYRLITSGNIKAVKIGSQWRVPESSLLEYINSGLQDSVSDKEKEPQVQQFKLPFE